MNFKESTPDEPVDHLGLAETEEAKKELESTQEVIGVIKKKIGELATAFSKIQEGTPEAKEAENRLRLMEEDLKKAEHLEEQF